MPSNLVELSILKQDKSIHGMTGDVTAVKNDTSCSNNNLETSDSGTEENAEDNASLDDPDKKQSSLISDQLQVTRELQSTCAVMSNGRSEGTSSECLVNSTFDKELANHANLPQIDHSASEVHVVQENQPLCTESTDVISTKTNMLEKNADLKAGFSVDSEAGYTIDGSGTNSFDRVKELDGDIADDESKNNVRWELEALHRSNERITPISERKLNSQKDAEQHAEVVANGTTFSSVSSTLEHLRSESKTALVEGTGSQPLYSNLVELTHDECLPFETNTANNSDTNGEDQTFGDECKDLVNNMKGERQHLFNSPLDTSSARHSENLAVAVNCSRNQTKSQRLTENRNHSTDKCHPHRQLLSGDAESSDLSLPSPDEFNEAFEKYLQSPFIMTEDPKGLLEYEETYKKGTESGGSGDRSSVVSLEHNKGTIMFSNKTKTKPKVNSCENIELRNLSSKQYQETKKLGQVRNTSPPSSKDDQKRRQNSGVTPSKNLRHSLDASILQTEKGMSSVTQHTEKGMSPSIRHTENGTSPDQQKENRMSPATRPTENRTSQRSQERQEQFSFKFQENVSDYCRQVQARVRHVHAGPHQFSRTSCGRDYTVPTNHTNTGALTDLDHRGATDSFRQHLFRRPLENDHSYSLSSARPFCHTVEPSFTGQSSRLNDMCYHPHIDSSLLESSCNCECVENPRGLEDCCTTGVLQTDCYPSWDPYSPSSVTQCTVTQHDPWARAWERAYQRQCNYIAHFVYSNKSYKLQCQ